VDERRIAALLRGRVLVLTGAGISVASGLPTFYGSGGLYEGLNPYELASPEAFFSRTSTVWNWYLMRIRQGLGAQPNAAHHALKKLEGVAAKLTIVTTNVDPLHERAGSQVYKLHGDILKTRCCTCGRSDALNVEAQPETVDDDTLPSCPCGGLLRPDVVWFGETPKPDAIMAVQKNINESNLVMEIGASGTVSYGFIEAAARFGLNVVRINPEPEAHPKIHCIAEAAETALPRLVLAAAVSLGAPR
jgi:NAD-dependent deacetylase